MVTGHRIITMVGVCTLAGEYQEKKNGCMHVGSTEASKGGQMLSFLVTVWHCAGSLQTIYARKGERG